MNDERGAGSAPSDQVYAVYTPVEVALLSTIGHAVAPDLQQLLGVALRAVPRAQRASLTFVGEDGQLRMLASSDAVLAGIDVVQLELGEGPDLDSRPTTVLDVPDLAASSDWPTFGSRAVELGLASAVRIRLTLPRFGRATLTCYAAEAHAFSAPDLDAALLVGSFLGLAVQNARQQERMTNLEVALETNRQIGTSIGIVMARELLTPDQAFSRLRNVSQHLHRKLREVADEVVRTGELPPVS